jgi:acyl-CoA reductase-like NAD-dependent aldehyde dehydrogenase
MPLRAAQKEWQAVGIDERLRIVRKIRSAIAEAAPRLADLFPGTLERTRADSLTSEIIPLAEACRFLELEAARILGSRRLSKRGRPFWLRSVEIEMRHEPLGVVLIIGPSNYPLFLPGVQMLQALVAGNAVLIKPGRGGLPLMEALSNLAASSGVPSGLLTVLDEEVESATEAIRGGVDKVIVTGSLESGRAVLQEAAGQVTPVIAELSGCDPVFVLESADIAKAVAAITFGCKLNGGATCIAPQRVFVHASVASRLRAALATKIPIVSFSNEAEALHLASQSPFALGASVFGQEVRARAFAKHVCAGVVVINDMIVPTADPRMPFGGRRSSGFGKTRGAEGLLEMTASKAVVFQRAKRLRHLEPPPKNAEQLFLAYLSANHAHGIKERWHGWRHLGTALSRVQRDQA